MKNLFVTATAAAFLTVGAAGAANAANANVPASSPYALMDIAHNRPPIARTATRIVVLATIGRQAP
jgi:hypothetical protein